MLALILFASPLRVRAQAGVSGAERAWQEAVLEVSVNAQSPPPVLVTLRDPAGRIWIEAGDFARLRLRVPAVSAHEYEGRAYFPLNAIRGIVIQLDEAKQRVQVRAPAQAFEPSYLQAPARTSTPLTPATPGAFLNYQLSAQRIAGDDSSGALGELGLFGPPGVLTDTMAVRSIDGTTQAVRLDTTFTHDFPQRLETLTLGDSISAPATWSDALRFAGLHWGTNFSIRPDLITAPLLSAGGTAVVPSTVDILVNNQRVSSEQVPAGPFVINNVPPLSGTGVVSVVVRDALGRTQVITQSFYSGPNLLAAGLSQYSVDLGSIRENYALESDDYGALFGSTTYRRGINDALTLEGHAEFLEHDARAIGLDGALRCGTAGILTLTLAQGGDGHSSGVLSGVGFSRSASLLSFTATTLFASDGFRQVGDSLVPGERFRQQTLLQAGLNLQRAGSVSVAYVLQTYQNQPEVQTLSGTYNLSLGPLGALNLVLTRSTGANASTGAFLSFTHVFDERTEGTLSGQGGSGPGSPRDEALVELAQNPPVGPGNGYRVIAATSGDYDADYRRQFESGEVELEAARSLGTTGQSALAQGALTWLDGEMNAARSITGSFAVVDAGGVANIPVYVENQLVTRTDDNGRALLPNLLSYVANRISIDPESLPLDTAIGARTVTVAPAFESGVVVRFPVEQIRAGIFRLVTESGEPVPPGATVRLLGKSFPVALNGMTYVTGFDHGMTATAHWEGHDCQFRLEPPPHDDPLPDMGTIVCHPYVAAKR